MSVDLTNLYQTIAPALVRRASAILGDPMEAEDAVHEAFTLGDALPALRQAADAGAAARLLWSRCVGRCLTRLRSARRRTLYEREAAKFWHMSRGLGSAARLQLRLDACRVYLDALIETASPEDALVVFMITWAGMTPSEAAAALPDEKRTPQALGQVNRRLLSGLAERFQELAYDDPGPGEDDE